MIFFELIRQDFQENLCAIISVQIRNMSIHNADYLLCFMHNFVSGYSLVGVEQELY